MHGSKKGLRLKNTAPDKDEQRIYETPTDTTQAGPPCRRRPSPLRISTLTFLADLLRGRETVDSGRDVNKGGTQSQILHGLRVVVFPAMGWLLNLNATGISCDGASLCSHFGGGGLQIHGALFLNRDRLDPARGTRRACVRDTGQRTGQGSDRRRNTIVYYSLLALDVMASTDRDTRGGHDRCTSEGDSGLGAKSSKRKQVRHVIQTETARVFLKKRYGTRTVFESYHICMWTYGSGCEN
jgi:hypothetical protein